MKPARRKRFDSKKKVPLKDPDHIRNTSHREMATGGHLETCIESLSDFTKTQESEPPKEEVLPPRGPWYLEMAPLCSITLDENNQYYPDKNSVEASRLDLKKKAPLKTWRRPTSSHTPTINRPRSSIPLKGGRTRVASVSVLQEVHQQQKNPDLSEAEEDSLLEAVLPDESDVHGEIHTTTRRVSTAPGPESYSSSYRNVLDFTLEDYYVGVCGIMNDLTVSPKATNSLPTAETQTVSATFLTMESDATTTQTLSKVDGAFEPNTYSKKVFVGGLPPDLDGDDIRRHFGQFGGLVVDWPHRARSGAVFPPKGYAFLLFEQEIAVHKLLQSCLQEEGRFYIFLSSTSQRDKKVQVRPWFLVNSEYYYNKTVPVDLRKTVFIGGVPRPMKACELAEYMDEKFGNVCYAAIDLDPDVNYPKGAGRVAFTSTNSFIGAVSSRFTQMTYEDVCKGIEVKPYVLDDQMCDECHGIQCDGKYAPFYCGSVSCLQYYCEHCWATVHALASKSNHRPLNKDTGDKPHPMPFH